MPSCQGAKISHTSIHLGSKGHVLRADFLREQILSYCFVKNEEKANKLRQVLEYENEASSLGGAHAGPVKDQEVPRRCLRLQHRQPDFSAVLPPRGNTATPLPSSGTAPAAAERPLPDSDSRRLGLQPPPAPALGLREAG